MKSKPIKKTYPVLAVRMTQAELDYIRREAFERNMKVSRYVKAVLAPDWAVLGSSVKQIA